MIEQLRNILRPALQNSKSFTQFLQVDQNQLALQVAPLVEAQMIQKGIHNVDSIVYSKFFIKDQAESYYKNEWH